MHLATESQTSGFLRHLRNCNNAVLPGERLPFVLDDAPVGWARHALAQALAGFPDVAIADGKVVLGDPAALPGIARSLAEQGHYRWRNEAFDVRATPDGPVLAQIDRGAIPSFGVL